MFSPNEFRQQFPEFDDPDAYSDPVLSFHSGIAAQLVNAERWGALHGYGVSLFVAHHLTLSARAQETAAIGGIPGEVKGPKSSQTVDGVSASYDTKAVTLTDAGYWNATSYGTRFYQLARMMGAGGLQL